MDDLYGSVVARLTEPGYEKEYATESDFEAEVWDRLFRLFGSEAPECCLTSHKERKGRSPAAWDAFCSGAPGPDVEVLGSKNRLDIVVKTDEVGSIGIEVKCLGKDGHTGKFTQGLGQAVLALANRDRTVLAIHCGTVSADQRATLRQIAEKITRKTSTTIIVVP